MEYDVFISCKSEDYKYAEEVYDFLTKNGFQTFLASKELRRLGESEYRRAISCAMKSSYHLIVFASNAEYVDSTWVYYEWDMFLNAKLKGRKDGQIMTILKDVNVDDINMDLWKYESFPFNSYMDNLLPYVVTPNYLQRRNDRKMSILHPIRIGHLYGLADDEDNIHVKGTWKSIGEFYDGVAFAKNVDGHYGMIDHFGNIVLPYQWMQIDEYHDGVARVKSLDGLWGFVDKSGVVVTPCEWKTASVFSDGLAYVTSDENSGYIQKDGKMVIVYNEGEMNAFSEGLACVSDGKGKWGYIDKSGELVIPYQWEKAGTFRNGIAYVYDDGQYGYIDRDGTFKVPMGLKDSDLTPIKAPDSGLWGYADRDGKVVIPFEWEYAREFSEGLACVEKNGVCGFIDYSGALVIPRRFLWAGDFKDGYAPIHDCVRAEASHVSKDGTLV